MNKPEKMEEVIRTFLCTNYAEDLIDYIRSLEVMVELLSQYVLSPDD